MIGENPLSEKSFDNVKKSYETREVKVNLIEEYKSHLNAVNKM